MYYVTDVIDMSALNFEVKRSKFKVTVELRMLEPSLHRGRYTVLDVSCRVRLSSCGITEGWATAGLAVTQEYWMPFLLTTNSIKAVKNEVRRKQIIVL